MRTWLLALAVAGCGMDQRPASSTTGIVITTNSLGVVALRVDKTDGDNSVLLVAGLDANDDVKASVQVTRGKIAIDGRVEIGAELVALAGGASTRMVTRETHLVVYDARPTEPIAAFAAIPEVATVLEREHVIVKPARAGGGERAYASGCFDWQLLANPKSTSIAHGCCTEWGDGTAWNLDTYLIRDDQTVVYRKYGPPCSGYWGEPCSGATCYYGPNGYARAAFYAPQALYAYTLSVDPDYSYGWCTFGWWGNRAYQYPPYCPYYWSGKGWCEFGDVAGSFPSDQGCPTFAVLRGDDAQYESDADPGYGAWDY